MTSIEPDTNVDFSYLEYTPPDYVDFNVEPVDNNPHQDYGVADDDAMEKFPDEGEHLIPPEMAKEHPHEIYTQRKPDEKRAGAAKSVSMHTYLVTPASGPVKLMGPRKTRMFALVSVLNDSGNTGASVLYLAPSRVPLDVIQLGDPADAAGFHSAEAFAWPVYSNAGVQGMTTGPLRWESELELWVSASATAGRTLVGVLEYHND